jgi:2-keto-4-pentenoate hydratase
MASDLERTERLAFDVEAAADLLVAARRERRLLDVRRPGPRTVEDAYRVQDGVSRRLGPIGGWKVGAKGPGVVPTAAPLPAGLVRESPQDWPAAAFGMIGIEAEIAFRMRDAIGPRSGPVAPEEVYERVASVHAAIEIVDTRLADWRAADRLWVLADSQSNGGFVYEPTGIAWAQQDFTDAQVRLSVGGRVAVERRGGNPAGDPRWLLVWLANHCATLRGGLAAGAVVTTGSYTGMVFVEPGAEVEASFDGLGAARIRFV